MTRVPPLPESEAVDKVENNLRRFKELIEADEVPEPVLQYARIPAYLQDFFMNFKKFVWNEGKLDQRTKAIIALAVTTNAKCAPWAAFFTDRARALGVSDQQIAEVIAVGATNTMYNVFFKFRDIAGTDVFSGMSVGLRAHTFKDVSLSDVEVELIDIALSDINACKPCVSGHVKKAGQLGVSDDAILEAIQVAAIMHGACQFVNAASA